MDEELRLRKLAAKGDALAEGEAVRLARRRGEKLVLVLNDEGEVIQKLDPDKDHCWGYPCGGCDQCLLQYARYSNWCVLDCRDPESEEVEVDEFDFI